MQENFNDEQKFIQRKIDLLNIEFDLLSQKIDNIEKEFSLQCEKRCIDRKLNFCKRQIDNESYNEEIFFLEKYLKEEKY